MVPLSAGAKVGKMSGASRVWRYDRTFRRRRTEMSDEQRSEEEIDVEGHLKDRSTNEPAEDDENEFEAHLSRLPNVRMD